jgi:hypothetical protein
MFRNNIAAPATLCDWPPVTRTPIFSWVGHVSAVIPHELPKKKIVDLSIWQPFVRHLGRAKKRHYLGG